MTEYSYTFFNRFLDDLFVTKLQQSIVLIGETVVDVTLIDCQELIPGCLTEHDSTSTAAIGEDAQGLF